MECHNSFTRTIATVWSSRTSLVSYENSSTSLIRSGISEIGQSLSAIISVLVGTLDLIYVL